MKIIRVASKGAYNALEPFDREFLFNEENKNIIEPICFVGTNGSGKSNLLELITELFYTIENDIRLIEDGSNPKRILKHELLIEYILFDKKNNEFKVRIDSYNKRREWKLSLQEGEEFKEISMSHVAKLKEYLPTKVIAYSSGQNESLSYWFNELNKQYSKEVREAADSQSRKPVEDTRLIYMDYDCNSSILLANYLYHGPDAFDSFEKYIRLKDVSKFRVFMDFKLSARNHVRLSREHREYISKLRSSATVSKIEMTTVTLKNKEQLEQEANCIFDYYVDSATRKAIRKNFSSAYELFMVFQKFELLNQLKLSGAYRKLSKKKDQLHKPPVVGHEDRIFRIEEIHLNINGIIEPIPYIGISDGEHQFLQTVGTILLFDHRNILFLLDEPETHFNPQWRRNLVSILQNKTENRYQEIVLTTHSPFIVSDCRKYNVFLFERQDGKVRFKPFDIETFGTSVDTILLKAFMMEESISSLAETKIEDIMKEEDYTKAKAMLERLGSSYEKMEAARYVQSIAPRE